ncbi:PAS domain S-box protein [Halorubrum sp. JWXQ-INN 858]|uniref:sensor histidine kinase n=1 Tax=Halorubrum sp. JWXQ-INN 858 TaxID=2690782 RepID=UPI0013585DCF|nr:PAS domain-containing sensor histidine kinase [Halorubrum sp. JWXQ-INN 858]MWV66105.1 PAS domain S-box protein [Halorubrum sp. JWXQ-INN 858]
MPHENDDRPSSPLTEAESGPIGEPRERETEASDPERPSSDAPPEAALADPPTALQAFVDRIPGPALACDPDTLAIRAVNDPAAALFGIDSRTLTFMGVPDLGETGETTDGEPVETVLDAVGDDGNNGSGGDDDDDGDRRGGGDDGDDGDGGGDARGDARKRFEWTVERGDGDRRRVAVVARRTTIDGRDRIVLGVTDVTPRARAEREVRTDRRLIEAVSRTVPAALFRVDANGTLSWWNDRLVEDVGDAEPALSGRELTGLFDDEDAEDVAGAVARVYRAGDVVTVEPTLVTRAGEDVPYRLTLGPVTGRDGAVVGAVGIGEDRTGAATREERVAVLTRVLRHNFRNDLNAIVGFSEQAMRRAGDPVTESQLERVVDTAGRLLRAGETARRIDGLIEDRPEPVPIRLSAAIEAAVEALPDDVAEEATIEVAAPEGIAVSAVERFPEALTELVDNAVRHAEGGDARVRIRAAELPSESWASLVVADDGPGIPAAERAVLTGEETPLDHSSGLGLWYVNWVVSAGGGSVDIAESKGGGSRIELTLRLADSRGDADSR